MARFQRQRDAGEEQRATTLELFYDLVFVFAITQVSHLLLDDLTLDGGGRGGPRAARRVVGVELHDLGHERARPGLDRRPAAADRDHAREPADGGRDPARRSASTGSSSPARTSRIQVGRHTFLTFASASAGTIERERAGRILTWFVAAGVLWIAGGLADGPERTALWLAALAIDYTAPLVTFWVPGRARLAPSAWDVETSHFAERFQLFVIIALGETIVITGATTSELDLDVATVVAFAVAFLGTAALWWLYFDYVATIAERRLELADRPDRARARRVHVPARRDRRRDRR